MRQPADQIADSTSRRLWVRYVLALTIILVLLVGTHWLLRHSVEQSQHFSSLTQLSAKLQLDSQRTTVLAETYYRERYRSLTAHGTFRAAIEEFNADHRQLNEAALRYPLVAEVMSGETNDISLNNLIVRYNELAEDIIGASGQSGQKKLTELRTLASGPLLEKLQELGESINIVARQQADNLTRQTEATLIAAIFTLLLEAIVIFWPAHRMVKHSLSSLYAQRRHLESAQTSLEEQNKQLQSAYARIEHDAMHDPLTGLANRRYLDETLSARVADSKHGHHSIAIIHVDLDRFKEINDTMGHPAGDHVLRHTAQILRNFSRADDLIARIGGDEFTILVSGPVNNPNMLEMARRIIRELAVPIEIDGTHCRLGASAGVATGSIQSFRDGKPIDALLANSDLALYRAKQEGRGRVCLFDDEIRHSFEAAKKKADEVATAIAEKQFIAHYQPQYDAKTRKMVGVEALARWQHPTRGLLSPFAFLDAADDLQQTHILDEMIMEYALADYEAWMHLTPEISRIAVNVSADTLARGSILASLGMGNPNASAISFEIHESTDLESGSGNGLETICALQQAGFEVEIDDFGTQNASLLSLMTIRPKRVKIARELIEPITDSKQQQMLVQTIIDLSRSCGIETVAEGVETAAHADLLAEMGCDILQGYGLAKPMSSLDLARLLSAEHLLAVLPDKDPSVSDQRIAS